MTEHWIPAFAGITELFLFLILTHNQPRKHHIPRDSKAKNRYDTSLLEREIVEHVDRARKEESEEKREKISERKELVRECLPPIVSTDTRSKYMHNQCEKRSENPLSKSNISSDEVEDILYEDESEDNEESEEDDILFGESKILSREPDTHEVLCSLLEY